MSLLSSLFGRPGNGGHEPWTEASIYRLIVSALDPGTGKLKVNDLVLPDEQSEQGIRWAAGAMDGVGSHHAATSNAKTTAKRVASLMDDFARTGNLKSLTSLYAVLKDGTVIEFLDEVIQIVAERQTPVQPYLQDLAIKLAMKAADRGPVKVGIALLGVMRLREHEDTILTLGKHDEFTLFAAVALRNMLDDATLALWTLARHVDGWGRIQTVERLVPTDNQEIQRWLRTEGFRNSIMYEYLAHIAAVHGRLRDALAIEAVDSAELVAAAEIIGALISGNGAPAAGIDDYDDAAEVCCSYLGHALRQPTDLTHFLTARLVLDHVEQDKREPADRLKNGWSDAARDSVSQLAKRLLEDTAWPTLMAGMLESGDETLFHKASDVARHLGVDTFSVHWQRLTKEPQKSERWFHVMQRATAERIDQIVKLAEAELALAEIATGPAEELGIGPEFEQHRCLDFVLQDLAAYPGKGWRLVQAGLTSPVVRNRNMALNALKGWGADAWPPQAMASLRALYENEPNSDLRKRIEPLLAVGC